MPGPLAALLPDGKRLHLQHGPIDLVIEAFGSSAEVQKAYARAGGRFETILPELVAELPRLRTATHAGLEMSGSVARRMRTATLPLSTDFITPMAAVAGAVSDEVLNTLVAGGELEKAYVNNGGDIALHLARGGSFDVGIAAAEGSTALSGTLTLGHGDRVRGIATSGCRGRSHSLGIADAVTVLAASAAQADAAATLISNAVDLPGHAMVKRVPARDIDPDSDLGGRLVTEYVGHLAAGDIDTALAAGEIAGQHMFERGLIEAAALNLKGSVRFVGEERLTALPEPEMQNIVEREAVHA